MDKLIKQAGVLGLLTVALSAGSVLSAQEQPVAATQMAIGQRGFSEQKLNAFAAAYVKVARIYRDHAAQVESARTSREAYQARSVIDSRTSQAIQEEGLSPDEYIAVVRTINEDPVLGRKIARKIHTLQ